MRPILLGLACALACGLLVPPAGTAAVPCWKAAIADWSQDRSLAGRFPPLCLRQAMQNAPVDLKIYSTLEGDLEAALEARSSRRLAGVHITAASLDAGGHQSSVPFLIALLGGLGALVATCAGVAAAVRRRRS